MKMATDLFVSWRFPRRNWPKLMGGRLPRARATLESRRPRRQRFFAALDAPHGDGSGVLMSVTGERTDAAPLAHPVEAIRSSQSRGFKSFFTKTSARIKGTLASSCGLRGKQLLGLAAVVMLDGKNPSIAAIRERGAKSASLHLISANIAATRLLFARGNEAPGCHENSGLSPVTVRLREPTISAVLTSEPLYDIPARMAWPLRLRNGRTCIGGVTYSIRIKMNWQIGRASRPNFRFCERTRLFALLQHPGI